MCDKKLIEDYNKAKNEQKAATAELLRVLSAKLKEHSQNLDTAGSVTVQTAESNGSS